MKSLEIARMGVSGESFVYSWFGVRDSTLAGYVMEQIIELLVVLFLYNRILISWGGSLIYVGIYSHQIHMKNDIITFREGKREMGKYMFQFEVSNCVILYYNIKVQQFVGYKIK
jgi:hypothetical protein